MYPMTTFSKTKNTHRNGVNQQNIHTIKREKYF